MLSNSALQNRALKTALDALAGTFASLRVVDWDDPIAVRQALVAIEEHLEVRPDEDLAALVRLARRALGRVVM